MPKFALMTTLMQEFDSAAELDHFVKEHSDLEFDDKVTLLKDRKVVIADTEDDTVVTVEILTELAPTGDVSKEATTEQTTERTPNA